MGRVIVQTISTHWTKKARGAHGASLRNATPETYQLDPSRLPDDGAAWQDVLFGERGSLLDETYRSRILPADFHRVSILLEHESEPECLIVQLFGKTAFHLKPKQTGRILYNFSDDVFEDGWRNTVFQKVVVHVAFAMPAHPTMFMRVPERDHVSLRDMT
jgi:hypothetical protein